MTVSEYGYLPCVDCRDFIWLGKAVKDDDGRIVYFDEYLSGWPGSGRGDPPYSGSHKRAR